MSDEVDKQEELNKLEEQACFELCQIIAEAMQTQNVDLLDQRIAEWKNKYKKLLDGSVPNSKFKKKIEFLLNEYYSSVTRYIQEQIKFREYVKIENQSKAIRKLYVIIKETNDLKTLKKKVKEWENKYPYESFLKMYKKKIDIYTSRKHLEDNAFDQEKAFNDLIEITKINGSFEELKYELSKWEENYSIHDKYELDDFLKNENEVKEYTSDKFLYSISNDYDENGNKLDINDGDKNLSSIDKQAEAFAALLAIVNKPNNESKMFEWVYKYRNIKFNDKYKELILSATYLDYSPTFLNRIKVPNTNLSNPSVSLDEYNNIDKLKKYSVISYFNLLLPTGSRITNDYFTTQLLEIYNKSEQVKHSNSFTVETPTEEIEVKLPEKEETKNENKIENIDTLEENDLEIKVEESLTNNENSIEIKLDTPIIEDTKSVEVEEEPKNSEEATSEEPIIVKETAPIEETIEESKTITETIPEIAPVEEKVEEIENIEKEETTIEEPIIAKEPASAEEVVEKPETTKEIAPIEKEVKEVEKEKVIEEKPATTEEPIEENIEDPVEIISISPMFFEAVHRHAMQANLIESIDETADKYSEKEYDENTIDFQIQKNKTE